uniref:Uncharacterized protein n=1 Tax=Arundo donax TaxID=35708 RepID=A0A0A9DU26_ARUDO
MPGLHRGHTFCGHSV